MELRGVCDGTEMSVMELRGVCDGTERSVVVLDHGEKIADGTPEEVSANQDVIDAYLGVAH